MKRVRTYIILCLLLSGTYSIGQNIRTAISLNDSWLTRLTVNEDTSTSHSPAPVWEKVNVPHNWDDYYGYRRMTHGNLHGAALYKRSFVIKQQKTGRRFLLFFEGVGSYATVSLNGTVAGKHAGGRTTFTIDVTGLIKTDGTANELVVFAEHPSGIRDLPWVCGGCSDERGFSEGSQPLGIFRPVTLQIVNETRIVPFGIHAWTEWENTNATLHINTTIKSNAVSANSISIVNKLLDASGKIISSDSLDQRVVKGDSIVASMELRGLKDLHRWSTSEPYLYKIVTEVKKNNRIIDLVETEYGFRSISWSAPSHQFLLNDQPVFLNGIAEYEHLLGASHAFTETQIRSRLKWIVAAGFNAFRDGHQPHHLLYGHLFNIQGILWWTQLSAHVWFDTPAFREQFKQLLREWVIERRNDPSVILWGLQNESKLPEAFARECTELIRSLDPTASKERLVTTCNGGSGTDWDVPQNWTGTYGGNPDEYGNDLKKQVLVGEYGAWRSIDLHTEGDFKQNGPWSEDRMTLLLEKKVRLAESVKDSCAGHFQWLLTSHDNPGRVQGGEGLRDIDRIGPVNYKGLLTPWEEPTDAFYMYRSNYTSPLDQPMVYIASHTWPNRWMTPGVKDSINVYSNCDEVELFNDIEGSSLGKQKRNGIGTHFQWNNVNIRYNVLYAVGYHNGKAVARDTILLLHLPASPNHSRLYKPEAISLFVEIPGLWGIHVNCGGSGQRSPSGSIEIESDEDYINTWTDRFVGLPKNFASQRRTFSPIISGGDADLFDHFRYGREELSFEYPGRSMHFPLKAGSYLVKLYFVEPWLGIGGGFNAKGMRVFDVAINGKTVIDDLDIWSEAGGANKILLKTTVVKVNNGRIKITFPEIKAGQAIICGFSIISLSGEKPLKLLAGIDVPESKTCLDIGDQVFKYEKIAIHQLPSSLFGANIYKQRRTSDSIAIQLRHRSARHIFIGVPDGERPTSMLQEFELLRDSILTDENGGRIYRLYRKLVPATMDMKLKVPSTWLVMAQEFSQLQPAFDLKPVTAYRTAVAVVGKNAIKDNFGGRETVHVISNEQSIVEWPMEFGVADIYSFTIKYFWPTDDPISGRLELFEAGGTMMQQDSVNFTFTREGKWNQFTINTNSMINAGRYRLRLVIDKAEDLRISGIDVQ